MQTPSLCSLAGYWRKKVRIVFWNYHYQPFLFFLGLLYSNVLWLSLSLLDLLDFGFLDADFPLVTPILQ
jgi:hypothetical protein